MSIRHRMQRMDAAYLRAHRTDDWSRRGNKCAYCREPLKRAQVTGDHAKPRALGGVTSRENIRSACVDCNSAKGAIPEKLFKKALRHPPKECPFAILLAHSRFRIWRRTEQAERRIRAMVGLP